MNVTWVLEKSPYGSDEDAEKLAVEAKAQGYNTCVFEYKAFNQLEAVAKEFNHSPTIFHGSIETADRYSKQVESIPGAYYNHSAYFCSKYYPLFGTDLVNWDALYVPAGSLGTYFEAKGIPSDGLFFRPDSGKKYFKPRVVYPDEFAQFNAEALHYCTPSQMVLFCQPKMIESEYRILYVDGAVVTGSQYHQRNALCIQPEVPDEIKNFAKRVGDRAAKTCDYVLRDGICFVDVGIVDGIPKLLEISAFSCAGLYACDIKKVVEAVSESALRVFNDYLDRI